MFAMAVIACSSGADMMSELMDSGVPDAGAQPTPKPVGQFVGYTTEGYFLTPREGEGGLFNTYAACQADFGSKARICTVTDVLGTLELPAPPPGGDLENNTESGAWLIANNLDQVPSCWASDSGTASVLDPLGGIFSSAFCGSRRVLACCTVE